MKKKLLLSLMLLGASSLFAAVKQQDYGETQTIPTADGSSLNFGQAYIYYNSGDGKTVFNSSSNIIENMVEGSYIIFKLSNSVEKDFLLSFKGAQGKKYDGILGIDLYNTDPIANGSVSPFFNQNVTITQTSWSTYNDYTVYVPSVPAGTLYMKLTANNACAGNFKEFSMTEFNNSLNTATLTFDIQKYFTTSGTIKVGTEMIDNTKNNSSVTYMFTVPESGTYNVLGKWASKYDATITMNISTNSTNFDNASDIVQKLTKTGDYNEFKPVKWKQFNLKANTVYYLLISFQTSESYAGNINYLALTRWYNVTDSDEDMEENEIYYNGTNYTAKTIALNDNIDYYLPFDVTATYTSYTRTVKDDTWNALYLPYAVITVPLKSERVH